MKKTEEKTTSTSLPKYIRYWLGIFHFVNVVALLHSVRTWIRTKNFSFVTWPVIVWSLFANVINMHVQHEIGKQIHDMTSFFAVCLFFAIWSSIFALKYYFEEVSKK